MALRKEQVLLLLCVGAGALVWKSGRGDAWIAPRVMPSDQDYAAKKVPVAPLVAGALPEPARRSWFREPSETQPLPPRELPLPAREPLFLVALPLDPGPDLQRCDLLRLPGEPVTGVTLEDAPDGAPPEAPGGAGEGAGESGVEATPLQGQDPDRLARIYDRVWVENLPDPYYGNVSPDGDGIDRFELAGLNDYTDVVVHLRRYSPTQGKLLSPPLTFGTARTDKVVRIELADNLRNRVGFAVRKVPEDTAHVAQRLELIDWLLEQGRQEAWVYDVALEQADILTRTSAGLAAQRVRARVLRAKGDLAAEYAIYGDEITADGPAGAFQYHGRGLLQARLGLFAEAEADLRKAIELVPSDPRLHAALAQFLRGRGRARAAAASALEAVRTIGSVADRLERQEIVAAAVGGLLGVGDLDAARQALGLLAAEGSEQVRAYLRACIDYAAGEVAAARDGFRAAAAGSYGAEAQLGLAACQLRAEEWRDAVAGFTAVAEQAPLLRGRAFAGLALVYVRLGQYDAALSHADRALEAEPQQPYARYLKGRALRAQSLLGPAEEEQQRALRQRDDFVAALAEVAEVRMAMAGQEAGATERATHALTAMRYADRAVELSAVPLAALRELQALAHLQGADLKGAGQAFARARELTTNGSPDPRSLFAQAGMVVVDYAQQNVELAKDQLRSMRNLPQDHPMRQWAETTQRLIDDHEQKEQLDDRFERDQLGQVWQVDGGRVPEVVDQQVVVTGQARGSELTITRRDAVPQAKSFLAMRVAMQIGAGQDLARTRFVGVRIVTKSGGTAAAAFRAQIGFGEGRPRIDIVDGRDKEVHQVLPIDVDPRARHTLELRVEPREEGNLLRLLFLWGGAVVHVEDLRTLNTNTPTGLETQLVVDCAAGAAIEVRFDDYHLERRRHG